MVCGNEKVAFVTTVFERIVTVLLNLFSKVIIDSALVPNSILNIAL